MYLCYLDESGVPEIPGNSTHFVLGGIAIPIERWREADASISAIMSRYGLARAELHTAWLLRKYLEQSKIDGFEQMDWNQRRAQVSKHQVAEIHRVRKFGVAKRNAQLKKVYRHTAPYIHLTYEERHLLVREIAHEVGRWEWAGIFASCIDKGYFVTRYNPTQVNTSAFSRVLVQFAVFLNDVEESSAAIDKGAKPITEFGLLIHDNNPTVALRHTLFMQRLRAREIVNNRSRFERIIETPLFVDSALTRMVQLSDLWSYALRRYVENDENDLFGLLYNSRAKTDAGVPIPFDRVMVHHLTETSCNCLICSSVPPT